MFESFGFQSSYRGSPLQPTAVRMGPPGRAGPPPLGMEGSRRGVGRQNHFCFRHPQASASRNTSPPARGGVTPAQTTPHAPLATQEYLLAPLPAPETENDIPLRRREPASPAER